MTHDDVRSRLSDFIDGALDAREARRVEAHLTSCRECAAHLAELRAMLGMLRDAEPVPAPEGFAAAVRGRLEQMSAARPTGIGARFMARLPRIETSWRTAAAVAAVAVVGLFALNVLRQQPGTDAVLAPAAEDQGRESGDFRQAAPPIQGAPAAPPPPEAMRPPVGQARPLPSNQSTLRAAAPGASSQYLVRTGKVVVEVDVFEDASRRVETIAETMGGIVATSSVAQTGGAPQGSFVLRVPERRFSDAVRQIESLGRVQSRAYRTEDVGEEYVDVDARLRNLHRQEARLLSVMKRASRVPDLVAIEGELSRVRGEIERLTGRRRHLANRIERAAIEVEITQRPAKKPGGR
jgi:hypothetical protein